MTLTLVLMDTVLQYMNECNNQLHLLLLEENIYQKSADKTERGWDRLEDVRVMQSWTMAVVI